MKTLSNQQLSIQVSEHGAELCSIKCNNREYLWQADPVYWKRHSPVLFPIVGSVWENQYRHNGHTYLLTQHGFARDMDFQLTDESDNELCYQLTDNEETHAKFPFPFLLRIGYRIEGKRIDVMWKVKNTGNEEMHFQIGAHPAFYFPHYDAEKAKRGFFGFDKHEGLNYILISEKGCAEPSQHYDLKLIDGLLPLDIHTFDQDALILEDNQVNSVTLYTPDRQPWLSLNFHTPPCRTVVTSRQKCPFCLHRTVVRTLRPCAL